MENITRLAAGVSRYQLWASAAWVCRIFTLAGTTKSRSQPFTVPSSIEFLDTADMYGPFANERLVGRAIRGRRREGHRAGDQVRQRTDEEGSFLGVNGRPEYVRRSCDASLQRLGVDHIDLYYQHRVDRSVPIALDPGS